MATKTAASRGLRVANRPDTAINVQNVVKSFGSHKALQGVSFQVNKGEIFGFLGPNGAGKTTTIRSLMDFIRPDSGSVSVLGKDVQQAGVELKRSIGYLPSGNNLYDHWTVGRHIEFAAALRGINAQSDLPKQLELDLSRKVGNLSTGNCQKLMIVLAMLGDPELLILDEPTKGLDPILQSQLYDLLLKHRDKGGTVFMSSHNLQEVQKVCSSVAVIREGKIIMEETVESILRKSIHHVSATFKTKVDPKVFDLKSVEVLSSTAKGVDLRVKGDIAPIIKALGRQNLSDLEIVHASLEELFLEMYK